MNRLPRKHEIEKARKEFIKRPRIQEKIFCSSLRKNYNNGVPA